MESSSGGHNLPKIQVFRPTMDEFRNFSRFIEFIELQGAHKAGLAKVIPPKEWIPRKAGYSNIDLTIPAPILQTVSGNKGLYQQYNVQQKPILLKDFEKLANDERHRTPRFNDLDELERKFWKNITFNPPIYGADISGSLYDKDQDIWNINHLGTILDHVSQDYSVTIEGVNTAYLYFGMWKTSFCWHTEDMDLYSINYLHYGAPKSWYAIPPEHGRRLERLAAGFFPNEAKQCPAFLRHKMTHISPHVLRRYSIPFNKITQETGEFMLTFPYSYHAGYNHGYNCAESTNFASVRWIEYGKRCIRCTCSSDMVQISMDSFIKNYQPERYELWKAGLDVGPHPEDDQSKLYSSTYGSRTAALPEVMSKIDSSLIRSSPQEVSKSHSVSRRHPVLSHLVPGKNEAQLKSVLAFMPNSCPPNGVIDSDSDGKELQPVGNLASGEPDEEQRKRKRSVDVKDETLLNWKRRVDVSEAAAEATGVGVTDEWRKEALISSGASRTDILQKDVPYDLGRDSSDLLSSEHSYISTKISETNKKECFNFNFSFPLESSLPNTVHLGFVKPPLQSRSAVSPAVPVSSTDGSSWKEMPSCQDTLLLEKPSSLPSNPLACQSVACLEGQPAADTLPGNNFCSSFDFDSQFSGFRDDFLLISEEIVEVSEDKFDGQNIQAIQEVVEDDVPKESSLLSTSRDMKKKTLRKQDLARTDAEVGKGGRKKSRDKNDHGKVVASIQKSCPQLAGVAGLFQFIPDNQAAEIEYNHRSGLIEPFCDVCSLFTEASKESVGSSSGVCNIRDSSMSRPLSSRPVVPEALFRSGARTTESHTLASTLGTGDHLHVSTKAHEDRKFFSSLEVEDGGYQGNVLLTCSRCLVCVHASCYGELNASARDAVSWMCDRCLGGSFADACCLCLLRGGALKRTSNGLWAHIVCALTSEEASFEDVVRRFPIIVGDVASAHRKPRCIYCAPLASGPLQLTSNPGVCVQCTHARCPSSFHVTCARAAGVSFRFSLSSQGQEIAAYCAKHCGQNPKETNAPRRSLPPISRGEHVIAKHRNRRFYRCLVIGVRNQLFFRVAFEDGSFSNDTFPEDIESPPCSSSGVPPAVNSAVKVRWSDGLLYDAVFKGTNSVCLYQVQFEDGSVLNLERKDIWSEREELPKKVTSRLSVATEKRHNLFEEESQELSSRTRSVQLCYIRDENFVNP